ncbi:MAG: NUDIX domain-containing protein [Bacilli bacterium]|nr:NUDIX domain-containing protein [Bacilli bacterium]
MNIDLKEENKRYNARVSAIIYNKDKTKILLFKVEDGRDYYLLPGGRIEICEDSQTAIKREIKEELGYDLEFKLCAVQENFTIKDNKEFMQHCFCYKGIYNGEITKNRIKCKDNNDQYFYWVNIDELLQYKIYPKSTYELINSKELKHIVERVPYR